MPTPDLFDSVLCAALLLDSDGRVTRVGRGWVDILDWPATHLLGRPFAHVCDASTAGRIRKGVANIGAGAPSAIARVRASRPGASHLLRCRMQAVDGGIALVAEDIETRTARVADNATMQSLVEFTADSWFVHDLEGRIRDANAWASQALGYTREEFLAMRVADVETTIQPGRLDGVWNRMEVGRPITVEGRQRRKDGSIMPVEVRLGLFETESGEVLMLAVARDITRRKAQEAELRRLNEELEAEVARRTAELAATLAERQALLDHLADGVVAVDEGDAVRLANPAVRALLRLASATVGRPAAEVLPAEAVALLQRARDQGETVEAEIPLSGDRVAAAVASPLGEDGRNGVVMRLRDVTLAREVDRMKTDFIATVSHELRTPLTSVLGFAKLSASKLERSVLPHVDASAPKTQRAIDKVRQNLEIVVKEGERLTALINDVLDISKMESGKVEWRMQALRPVELVERAAAACAGLFPENGPVRLVVEVDDALPDIHGDADRLMQVLVNLLSNAAKFTSAGTVTVRAVQVTGGVELSVADTGDGIDPSLHESIFERFSQAGDTLTDRPRGTGLGLPICQQIARAHGSQVVVDSAPGEGSRFHLVLAAEPHTVNVHVDQLVERVRRSAPDAARHGQADILVVDDDANLRELLREALTDAGYAVREATDGVRAIEQVRERVPDLVILDVRMPGLSGFDVASVLRSDPRTEAVPILLISIVVDERRALRIGLDHALSKPLDEQQLLDSVAQLVDLGRSPYRLRVVRDDEGSDTYEG